MTGDAVAASIAHELRQPLTAMVTTADAGLRFLDRSAPEPRQGQGGIQTNCRGRPPGWSLDWKHPRSLQGRRTMVSVDRYGYSKRRIKGQ